MTLIDLLIFACAALFSAIMALILSRSAQGKKRERRLSRVKASLRSPGNTQAPSVTLRRQSRDSGSLTARLTRPLTFMASLHGRLDIAGLAASAENYLLLCLGLGALAALGVTFGFGTSPLLGLLAGFVIGFGLPHLYVGRRINRRRKAFLLLFPDGIDLIVRGLRAGLPVAKSMQVVATEIGDPLRSVFKELVDQMALGVNLEESLAEMARRLKITEFNFFVTSIILQRETGGNLAEILANLSEVLRQRHMMQLKIKAMSSEARASAAIVGSLPFLVFTALLFISPGYSDPLFNDFRGNIAALVAMGMLCLGVFIMNRMAKFEI